MAHNRQELDVLQKLATEVPAVVQYRERLASAHDNMGNLLKDLGQRDEAEAHHRQALQTFEKLAAEFPNIAAYQRDVAGGLHNLADSLQGTGKHNERLALYQRAIQLESQALERDPQDPVSRDYMGEHHCALGSLLVELGRRAGAEAEQQQGLALREKLAADFPTENRYGAALAWSHSLLGQVFTELGRWEEAEAHCRKALDLREKVVSAWPDFPNYLVERAVSYTGLGDLVRQRGRPGEALDWYAKAIAALEPVLAKKKRLVSARRALRDAHWGRARALDLLRRHADAVQDWERALALDDGQNRAVLQLGRAISQAHVSGNHCQSLGEAETLARDADGRTLEGLARLCALASVAVANDKSEAERAADFQEQYAARAVVLLRQAASKGHRDRLYLEQGTDLAALWSRADFQQLLTEAEPQSETRNP